MRHRAIGSVVAATVIAAVSGAGSQATATPQPSKAVASKKATRATFAGNWYGHTRFLRIGRKGRARERIDDGCCHRVIGLRFRISHVSGTTTRASARARVTRVHVYDHSYFSKSHPPPHVGEKGRLRLRHRVIHEPFTHTTFCGPHSSACGA
jgi:hypothetical protein